MSWKTNLTRSVGRQILAAKKNSPHIFFAAGVMGVVGSAVWACKSTLKLGEVLDEAQHDIDQVKQSLPRIEDPEQSYTEMDYNKDLGYVYGKAGLGIVKLYGPPVVLGVASIGLLTGSHVQLTRRNSAVTAAYVALQEAYEAYRERVREEVGEEGELHMYHGAETKVVKDENGKNKKVQVVGRYGTSPYSKLFDESSSEFQKVAEHNRFFIQCQQNIANTILHSKGHLFLNEVYDMLGFERTTPGAVVGWFLSSEAAGGDNYVDFGVYEAYNQDFVYGEEPRCLLDFNVDGPIYHLLGES